MNLQQHERIEQIKKLSGYMHIALRWAWYFLWVAWPIAVLVILLGRDVYLNLGSTSFHASEGTYLQRVLAAGLVSVGFFFLIFLTRHFRELMGYFHKGEIFNKAAIAHARKALILVWQPDFRDRILVVQSASYSTYAEVEWGRCRTQV